MDTKIITITYGRSTVNSNWYFNPNKGVNRLYYCHGGATQLSADNTIVTLRKGCYYIIPQNIEVTPIFESTCEFDHSFVNFISVPQFHTDHMIEFTPKTHPLLSDAAKITLSLAEKYPRCQFSTRYSGMIASYVQNMMLLMAEEFDLECHEDPRLVSVLTYIEHNYQKQITIKDLANLCYMSPNYFVTYFTEKMEQSPYQYIKNYRFGQAISMLQSGLQVGKVAEAVGYENISSFSGAFKKKFGYYPSEIVRSPHLLQSS